MKISNRINPYKTMREDLNKAFTKLNKNCFASKELTTFFRSASDNPQVGYFAWRDSIQSLDKKLNHEQIFKHYNTLFSLSDILRSDVFQFRISYNKFYNKTAVKRAALTPFIKEDSVSNIYDTKFSKIARIKSLYSMKIKTFLNKIQNKFNTYYDKELPF